MRKILIESTQTNPRDCSYGLPWEHDSNCYNFRMPEECVTVSNIEKITPKDVEVLVIGCDLDDYDFIAGMENLKQLYIYKGENLCDLSFIEYLMNLNHLYIAESRICSLKELENLLIYQREYKKSMTGPAKVLFGLDCICIRSESDLDGSGILKHERYLSELILNNDKLKT